MLKELSFPTISDSQRQQMLTPPDTYANPVRVVVDSDVDNEVDDYFALTWFLQSLPHFDFEGIYAAPYSFLSRTQQIVETDQILTDGGPTDAAEQKLVDRWGGQVQSIRNLGLLPADLLLDPQVASGPDRGMERSYTRTREILTHLNMADDNLFKGSTKYLGEDLVPEVSAAAQHLVNTAKTASPNAPLYVISLGCCTNVAMAILIDPTIIQNMVVIWTSGYPTNVTDIPNYSFNLEQDVVSTQVLFQCGVPLVYMPGFHVGQQLSLGLADVERWVRGQGAIGDLLYQRYVANPLFDYYGTRSANNLAFSWVIWDLICVAWLINPGWVSTTLRPTPILNDDLYWVADGGSPPQLREATGLSRGGIFGDLYSKLAAGASS